MKIRIYVVYLQAPKNVNQNCIDQYLNNKPNRRIKKEISRYVERHNFVMDYGIPKNPMQYQVVRPPYGNYHRYTPYPGPLPFSGSNIPPPNFNPVEVKQEPTVANSSREEHTRNIPTSENDASKEDPNKTKKKPRVKKIPLKKKKPEPNSKVSQDRPLEPEKADSRPRTEIWTWEKIQQMAAKDEHLPKNMVHSQEGEYIKVT